LDENAAFSFTNEKFASLGIGPDQGPPDYGSTRITRKRRDEGGADLSALPSEKQFARWSGLSLTVQPDRAGLAPILRAVVSLGAISADAETGSSFGPLGLSEV